MYETADSEMDSQIADQENTCIGKDGQKIIIDHEWSILELSPRSLNQGKQKICWASKLPDLHKSRFSGKS